MEADLQEREWVSDFLPAITSVDRSPSWFIGKYDFPAETVMTRTLRSIGQEFTIFKYQFRENRNAKVTERSWFPGYAFFHVDLSCDRWQQLCRVPGCSGLLGCPTAVSSDVMDDLIGRLAYNLPKNKPDSMIVSGRVVRVTAGAFKEHTAVVYQSDRKNVEVELILFGAPRRTSLPIGCVTVIA